MADATSELRAHSATAESLYWKLRSLITAEQLLPTERLGTERELAERMNVSRTLLRQALALLEQEGLVKRTIGRGGGIYVSDGKISRHLNLVAGVPTFLRQQGFASSTKVLSARIGLSTAGEARALGLQVGAPVYEIRRLRLADGVPLSLETGTLPPAYFPGLLDHNLESLYDLLTREYASTPTRADEWIESRAPSRDEAVVLGIDESAIVFDIRRVTQDQVGRPIECARDVFRADRTRIQVLAGERRVVSRTRTANVRDRPRPLPSFPAEATRA